MPTRSTGAAVVQSGERGEDAVPEALGDPGAVIFDINTAPLLPQLVAHAHLRRRMAHGVTDQVLQRPVQVARLGLDPGAFGIRALHAPGLPGKWSPETAAGAIREAVYNILEEVRQ